MELRHKSVSNVRMGIDNETKKTQYLLKNDKQEGTEGVFFVFLLYGGSL